LSKEARKFHSVEEIWAEYFPQASNEDIGETEPADYGVTLASKALETMKRGMKK